MHAPYVGISDSVDAVRALALSGATALACFGAAIGLSQYLTIYRAVRSAGWWIPATALGWAFAGGIAGGVSGLVGGSVTGVGPQHGRAAFLLAVAVGAISIGVLPATGQWLVLRRTSDKALAWIPAHAAALAAGVARGVPDHAARGRSARPTAAVGGRVGSWGCGARSRRWRRDPTGARPHSPATSSRPARPAVRSIGVSRPG